MLFYWTVSYISIRWLIENYLYYHAALSVSCIMGSMRLSGISSFSSGRYSVITRSNHWLDKAFVDIFKPFNIHSVLPDCSESKLPCSQLGRYITKISIERNIYFLIKGVPTSTSSTYSLSVAKWYLTYPCLLGLRPPRRDETDQRYVATGLWKQITQVAEC